MTLESPLSRLLNGSMIIMLTSFDFAVLVNVVQVSEAIQSPIFQLHILEEEDCSWVFFIVDLIFLNKIEDTALIVLFFAQSLHPIFIDQSHQ